MKKSFLFRTVSLVFLLFALSAPAEARDIAPIVSADWLAANMDNPRLIILDVRKVEQYQDGHIPNAISSFFRAWAFKRGELYSEIPEVDDLQEMIGEAGIGLDSLVVVTGSVSSPVESYQSARVACTLQYAGIPNVALLDGGVNAWVRGKKQLSTVSRRPVAKPFTAKLRRDFFADKEHMKARRERSSPGCAGTGDLFRQKETRLHPPGRPHPGALNMPTPAPSTRMGRSRPVMNSPPSRRRQSAGPFPEVVTYCDVGQCCPTWAYLLRELLGYRNIRLYDGSSQEWMSDPTAPVEK